MTTGSYSVASSKQLGQNANKQLELARRPPDGIVDHATRSDPVFNTLEQEGVLTYLSQLHKLVAETLHTTTRFPGQVKAMVNICASEKS